jgi:hypothetical protein
MSGSNDMNDKIQLAGIKVFASLVVLFLMTHPVYAENLFRESFDYGDTTTALASTSSWSSISAVLKYDHDGGLEHPQLGGETGGSMWLDFDAARAAGNSADFTNLLMDDLGEGGVIWFASLHQFVSGNTTHVLDTGANFADIGVSISSGGAISVRASKNTSANYYNNTGHSISNGTHLLLLRYTKGTGSSPVDSQVDLWINPSDTSSETALGTPDWTLDSSDGQIKWGRDGYSLTRIAVAQPSQQGRIDEIRIGQVYADVVGEVLPPPPTGTVICVR